MDNEDRAVTKNRKQIESLVMIKHTLIIIIGSNRCGTTSLFNYLGDNPEIQPADIKMTGYFLNKEYTKAKFPIKKYYSEEDKFSDYSSTYYSLNSTKYFLEANPDYLYSDNTAERIFSFKQHTKCDVKLICLVRNPIDRFMSMFQYLKILNLVPVDTTPEQLYNMQHHKEDSGLETSVLEMAHYSKYLKKYTSIFNKNELLVVTHEALKNQAASTMKDICQWLGVEGSMYEEYTFQKFNVSIKSNLTEQQKTYVSWSVKFKNALLKYPRLLKFTKYISKPLSNNILHKKNTMDNLPGLSEDLIQKLKSEYASESKALLRIFPDLKLDW